MEFDAVIKVNKEFGHDDFLRHLLIKLGTDKDTPADVVDAEIQEIKESQKEIILCTAQVEGHCTASVGYDRQEPYIDYETYREKIGDTYVTRQRPVTKYKTVTDWHLFQTPYSGEAIGVSYNSDKHCTDESSVVLALKTFDEKNAVPGGDATVDPDGLDWVLRRCKSTMEAREVDFPGNHHKNVSFKSHATVERLTCYKLPCYEVTYIYKGKSYTASCFACGTPRITTQTPPNDVDITATVKEKTQEEEKTQKRSWLWFWLSLAVVVLGFFLKFPWLFPVPFFFLIKAKKDTEIYEKLYQAYSDDLSKNIGKAKAEALAATLERYGFHPMERLPNTVDSAVQVRGATALRSSTGRIKWSWALSILAAIISLVVAYFVIQTNLHSPKQINIKVVEKTAYYDPDVSPYINGCYFIDLDYQIQTKKIGVEYMDVLIHVYDKNNKELGTINSSLSNIGAKKGKKTIITTTLKENQPENNNFFVELYESDLSALKFQFEINAIRFSDGKYYHTPNN